jgi:KDO2-lipid IV(A) lauroyltransferase
MKSLMNFFSRLWLQVVFASASWSMATRVRFAKVMAFLFWHLVPKRRHVTLTNLRVCFPDWTEEKRIEVAKECFFNLSRAALDHGVLWKGSREQVLEMVKFDDGLVECLSNEENRPLIMIAPHFAGLDATGIAFNTFVRGVSLYQRQSNPVWDKAAYDGRMRFSDPILIAKSDQSDLRPVIRAMRQGLPFYYLPDMDHGRRNSIFVPFFGVPAATLPMASRLAKMTKAKVLMCMPEMTEWGYQIHVTDFFDNFPTDNPEADTIRVTQELETWIKKYPSQYMWTHRRFKTRPEGEPSIY